MSKIFDEWYAQAKFNFVDEIPPLEKCENCGKDIISQWRMGNQVLLLHIDDTMCCQIEEK